jgi:hypothetical protein
VIRAIRTVLFACLLSLVATIAGAQCWPPADPHVRTADARLLDALTAGIKASPTLRDVVARLESSDVVAYVVFERQHAPHIAAHVSFISAAGGRRYLHVGIDPKYGGTPLIALLGHELQHAAEIAAEAAVVDARSMAALYGRIGFAGLAGTREHFESDRAISTGERVGRETRSFLAVEVRATAHGTR